MFKIFVACCFTLMAIVTAKPGVVTYTAPVAAAPLVDTTIAAAAVTGHAAYVAPYASSYNAHTVTHSVAAPFVAAATAPYIAAAPAHYVAAAAPLLFK
ncbi:cuticle protein 16.5-like [Glossina fuscipes]|uniref:Cuticle protein 16.5-like n=1 Tax=Glossina fuscipes TaxID=7396 RepID=A0A9C5YZV0_9MUSC|nr:cuticle protein 16.5-like [Glossina fuscipes]